jgi:hypothetical protein
MLKRLRSLEYEVNAQSTTIHSSLHITVNWLTHFAGQSKKLKRLTTPIELLMINSSIAKRTLYNFALIVTCSGST